MIEHKTFQQRDAAFPAVSPADDPAIWGPRLRRLVGSQSELCRQIEAMADRQTEFIRADDTDGLLRLLAERQGLLDELGTLNEAIGPFRAQWDDFSARLPEGERQTLRRLIGEIEGTIGRIAARDGSDRAELERRRDVVAEALGGLRRGKGAMAAYASGTGDDRRPTYQDRQG